MGAVVDTLRLSAEEAARLLESGELSAAELRGAYRNAIAERDGELHCFLRTTDDAEGDEVPIALKDVISTKGVETTAGSRILAGYVPVFDATVAARVKSAGLSLLGKTNTDEFAMGSSTENSARGPSRNLGPVARAGRFRRRLGRGGHRRARAVGAGLRYGRLHQAALRALRERRPPPDVRQRVRYGVVAFASSLDQVGLVAKTVRDVALLYSVIAGRDPRDSTTAELPEPVRLPEGDSLAGVRIGVPTELNEAEGIERG